MRVYARQVYRDLTKKWHLLPPYYCIIRGIIQTWFDNLFCSCLRCFSCSFLFCFVLFLFVCFALGRKKALCHARSQCMMLVLVRGGVAVVGIGWNVGKPLFFFLNMLFFFSLGIFKAHNLSVRTTYTRYV